MCFTWVTTYIWTQTSVLLFSKQACSFLTPQRRIISYFDLSSHTLPSLPVRCVSVSYLHWLDFLIFLTLLLLRTFYQLKMWQFDVLGMRLSSNISLWCVQEHLGQILLILPFIWREVQLEGDTWYLILWACTLLLWPEREVESAL